MIPAKPTPTFAKESDLCAAFTAAVRDLGGWTPYPETAGWDILLVRDCDGFQIGIEAKLRLNAKVIAQAIESEAHSWVQRGPDCRAVLVPDEGRNPDLGTIAHQLGITVIAMREGLDFRYNSRFHPDLPDPKRKWFADCGWYERAPLERCKVPAYVPDVEAGKPCPVCLTEWKIKAIKLTILLKRRGYLTRQDFKHFGVSISRWTQGGLRSWLTFGAVRGQWVARLMPDFQAQHPKAYAEIEADFEAWEPKEIAA
jgi:hypothetical protein